MVPDPVPPELTGLTMVEQQMIARAHPICKVIRKPGGQYAYEGHVIKISQDITTLATDLPWLPNSDELPIIIIQPPNGGDWEGREFNVNPTRVETALVWLIAYSPAYRDVRIDIGRLAELRRQQRQLPNDDDEVDVMSNFLHMDDADDDDADDDADDTTNDGQAGGSFIPSSGACGVSEQDAVRQALEELADFSDRNSPVNYPARGEPLREDTTPWLASMCFPVLFPLGVGDPFNDLRRRRVKFTHLMKFSPKSRTTASPVTGYWCLHTKMRRFFLVQNQEQVQVPVEEITEGELRQIMGRAVRYVSNVSGTDGYWLAQQGHLEDAVDQLPRLTAFTTYSAADHHWYDLHRLFPRATKEPPPGDDAAVRDIHERNPGLIDNPHIADWWTWERMKIYKEVFLAPDTADATWH
ncbi:unnamed protein product [Laminaria digitata]